MHEVSVTLPVRLHGLKWKRREKLTNLQVKVVISE
jgi:hypothetical protein